MVVYDRQNISIGNVITISSANHSHFLLIPAAQGLMTLTPSIRFTRNAWTRI